MSLKISDLVLFLFQPRRAFQKLNNESGSTIGLYLIVITAILAIINNALLSLKWPLDYSRLVPLAAYIVVGPIVAIVSTMLYSSLLSTISNFFKEDERGNEIRKGLPFSYVPVIIAQLLLLMGLSGGLRLFIVLLAMIWSTSILSVIISEIKSISPWKSFLSVLIASLIVCLPVLLVYFFVVTAR